VSSTARAIEKSMSRFEDSDTRQVKPASFKVSIMENQSRRKIAPNVLLLSAVSFLNDLSSEMIMPILPMFLTSLGGAGEVVGLAGGLRDSISSILKVFSGYWSDKTGRRKVFVYGGYAISAVFKVLMAVSRAWPSAVTFSSLERTGKGLRTAPRDAIIADSMPAGRGKGFGVHRAFDSVGAILGSVVALVLIRYLGLSFKTIILIAGLIGFVSLAPLHFVKEGRAQPQKVTLKMGIRALPKPLRLFILISGVFALGNFSYMFFIMRSQELFANRLSKVEAPILLYILFNIFYSVLAVPLGAITDKIGREKVIIFGYLMFFVTTAGFVIFNSLAAFIVLFALYGVVYAAVDGNQRAYVSDLAQEHLKATALGTFHTVTGLMALPASMVAGIFWEQIGPSATFIYGGTLALVSVVLFIVFRNYFSKPKPE
jgi:MFS family permease